MNDKNELHKKRQKKIKEKVDLKIAAATVTKGIVLLLTGNGKGKSTAAFGTLARALGHKKSCEVAQFIKGTWDCGEQNLFESLGVKFHTMQSNFTWESQNKEKDQLKAQVVWNQCKEMLKNENIDLIILDEITYMFQYKYIDINEFIECLKNRPKLQSVILTGRSAHKKLMPFCDTISTIENTKHAFDNGIKALKGVDW